MCQQFMLVAVQSSMNNHIWHNFPLSKLTVHKNPGRRRASLFVMMPSKEHKTRMEDEDMVKMYDTILGGYGPVGRLDTDNRVYNGEVSVTPVGMVTPEGHVYDAPFYGNPVGRVESDGKIYDSLWGGSIVGHVSSDGKVYDSIFCNHTIGRVEGEPKYFAGAALLLLKDKLVR